MTPLSDREERLADEVARLEGATHAALYLIRMGDVPGATKHLCAVLGIPEDSYRVALTNEEIEAGLDEAAKTAPPLSGADVQRIVDDVKRKSDEVEIVVGEYLLRSPDQGTIDRTLMHLCAGKQIVFAFRRTHTAGAKWLRWIADLMEAHPGRVLVTGMNSAIQKTADALGLSLGVEPCRTDS